MKNQALRIESLLDLSQTIGAGLFEGVEFPWEVLPLIGNYIIKLGYTLPSEEYDMAGENIWIAKSAKVAPTASITGPCIVGKNAEIRHCAFIRGNALIGERAVVGNSTEIKNAVLFNEVQVPHYNYVGDSILGFRAHMGAGAITSNVKADKKNIVITGPGGRIATGRKKVGAVLGDNAEVGCNAVLNPGTIVGRGSNIYPLCSVRGFVPAGHIYKSKSEISQKIL